MNKTAPFEFKEGSRLHGQERGRKEPDMRLMIFALAAAAVAAGAAAADPGDQWKKQWEKRAECEKKLYEAKSPWDFQKKAAECNRELAKLNYERRQEAAKAWREAEKKWRERQREYHEPYYKWDDD